MLGGARLRLRPCWGSCGLSTVFTSWYGQCVVLTNESLEPEDNEVSEGKCVVLPLTLASVPPAIKT